MLTMCTFSDPNCTLGLRQNMSCNFVSDEAMSFVEATEICNDLGLFSQKNFELAEIDWDQLTNESMIWIGSQRNGKEATTIASSRVTKSALTTSTANLGYYCQAWSIRRLEFQTIPCDSELPVFCQSDLIGKY